MIGQYACPKSVSSAFAYPPWRIHAIPLWGSRAHVLLSPQEDRRVHAPPESPGDYQTSQACRRSPSDHHRKIENDRPCLLIAQQLQAVESAIESVKKALIHDHISNCLERPLRTAGSSGRALKEFKLIAQYL